MYFDLHCHPSFKPFLTNSNPLAKDHCWKTYKNIVGILASQSSLEQLIKGKVRVATATIYVMEKAMSSSFMIRYIVPKLSMLSPEMLDALPTSQYFDRLHEEIDHLLKSQLFNPAGGQEFKIINSIAEIDPDKLNLILAIEGGQALDKTNTHLKDNLLKLKQGPHKFLYLTLVHATQFDDYCTHAFGMKLVKNNDEFKPSGYGFKAIGKEIIDIAYDKTQGNRILIDIKHMSLVSRRQFYHYRQQKGYQHIPIVATHMGLTGISYSGDSIAKYVTGKKAIENRGYVQVNYERPEGIGKGGRKTNFNPWSINLYNEEIPIILDSDGLIGFNLDQRILGANPIKGEFFDKREFEDILGDKIRLESGEFDDEPLQEEPPLAEEEVRELFGINRIKHLRHLCNQFLHIIRIGGARGWDHLCIGSDFDGLIDPINYCTNASEFNDLEQGLVEMLPRMIGEAKEEDASLDFDEGDIVQRVRGIMYDNAIRFLEKHF